MADLHSTQTPNHEDVFAMHCRAIQNHSRVVFVFSSGRADFRKYQVEIDCHTINLLEVNNFM